MDNVFWEVKREGAVVRRGSARNAAGPYMFHRIGDYISGQVAHDDIPAPTHMYLVSEPMDRQLDKNALYLPIDATPGTAGAATQPFYIQSGALTTRRATVSGPTAEQPHGNWAMVYEGVFTSGEGLFNRIYLAHDETIHSFRLWHQWAALEQGMLKLASETVTIRWQFNIGRGRNRVARGANPKRSGC